MSLPARFAPLARFGIFLPALVWLLALALSAWVAAKWYWRIAGPRTEYSHHAAQTDPLAVARDVAAAHLFGVSTQTDSSGQPVASTSRFSLIGVAANSGKSPGFAILQENGQPSISVIEGEEVQPGLKLIRVLPQAVELSRDGVRETLRLSEAPGGAPPPMPVSVSVPGPSMPPPPDNPQQSVPQPPQAASTAGATSRTPAIRPNTEE